MSVDVLGLCTTPRVGGNSELLLKECLRGATEAGANVECVVCRDLEFTGCIECNSCFKTGKCVIKDDMVGIYRKLISCDRLVLSTPMFFMNMPWLGKKLVDRCQCLWARKYLLGLPLFDPPRSDRQGVVLAVGATKGKRLFDGLGQTVRHFFGSLELDHVANLHIRRVDAKGEIAQHPTAMQDAFQLGTKLGTPDGITAA